MKKKITRQFKVGDEVKLKPVELWQIPKEAKWVSDVIKGYIAKVEEFNTTGKSHPHYLANFQPNLVYTVVKERPTFTKRYEQGTYRIVLKDKYDPKMNYNRDWNNIWPCQFFDGMLDPAFLDRSITHDMDIDLGELGVNLKLTATVE